MKNIELKNLARKAFPCKIFQGKKFLARSCKEKITLQDLARKKFPCKILQVIAFLQGSCKILARNAFFLNQGREDRTFIRASAGRILQPQHLCSKSLMKIFMRHYNQFRGYKIDHTSFAAEKIPKSVSFFLSLECLSLECLLFNK